MRLSLCVIWRRHIVRIFFERWHRTHHDAFGQIDVAHWLGLHNSAARLLQRILGEKWANCNSDAPHKQGHSAQNVTRYTK